MKEVRKALREAFGTRHYRITRNGEVHVFGKMPNTNKLGWYLFGYIGDANTEYRLKSNLFN